MLIYVEVIPQIVSFLGGVTLATVGLVIICAAALACFWMKVKVACAFDDLSTFSPTNTMFDPSFMTDLV